MNVMGIACNCIQVPASKELPTRSSSSHSLARFDAKITFKKIKQASDYSCHFWRKPVEGPVVTLDSRAGHLILLVKTSRATCCCLCIFCFSCFQVCNITQKSYIPIHLQDSLLEVIPRQAHCKDQTRVSKAISFSGAVICVVHIRKANYSLQVTAFCGQAASVATSTSTAIVIARSSESVVLEDSRVDFSSWLAINKVLPKTQVIKEDVRAGQTKLAPPIWSTNKNNFGNGRQIGETDPYSKNLQQPLDPWLVSFCEQLQVRLSSPAGFQQLGQPYYAERAVSNKTRHEKARSTTAAEAVALANAAVKAARDAASLAEAQILAEAENLEDLFFESDILYHETAGHDKTYRPGFADNVGDSLEYDKYLTGERSAKLDGFPDKTSLQSQSVTSMHSLVKKDKKLVRSRRRLERKSKKERALLKAKEATAAVDSSPDLLKLEKVKIRLQTLSGREPTICEWAEAVGTDQKYLKLRLRSGWQCREKMIKCNLRLVVYVAKNYQGLGMSLQDLMQEGSIGLIKGVENFDYKKGCKFSTYAYWTIRQAVTRAIIKHSRTIRLPAHVYELLSRIKGAKKSYYERGRCPKNEEVAKLVGLTSEQLNMLIKSTRIPKSIDQPAGRDQQTTIGEITADPHVESPEVTITKQSLRRDVDRLMQVLTPKERNIIRLRYGFDDGRMKTLDEIGKSFNVTRERIRQIEYRALGKLKQPHGNKALRQYLNVLN
eukprot:Gb_37605 [translate_table: standard]